MADDTLPVDRISAALEALVEIERERLTGEREHRERMAAAMDAAIGHMGKFVTDNTAPPLPELPDDRQTSMFEDGTFGDLDGEREP